MRKKLLFISISLFFLGFIPSLAQSEAKFETVDIELRPEYDRPSLLVMYRMVLSADTALPANLTLRIPAAAVKPHVIAIGATLDQVSDSGITYDLEPIGDWITVSFVADQPAVWFEYYDPRLTPQQTIRQFEYLWPADYTVNQLDISIQQPVDATDFKLEISPVNTIVGNDGLVYYTVAVGKVEAGKQYSLPFSYRKVTDRLTFEGLPVQAASPLPSTNWVMKVLPWGLGVLGVILIVGGFTWFRLSSRSPKDTAPRRRRSRLPKGGIPPEGEEAVYCAQCGRRSSPGDRFCRSCGAALRGE